MSVTITVSKVFLEEFPEINYQLYSLSSQEEEQEYTCAYTARGYYRELTDLLDLYQIPYQIDSSRQAARLHVLIVEEAQLALELKSQLEQWGFTSVEIAPTIPSPSKKRAKVSLAFLDGQTTRMLPFQGQVQLMTRLFWVPILFLLNRLTRRKPKVGLLAKTSRILYKPFSAAALLESIERVLKIALPS